MPNPRSALPCPLVSALALGTMVSLLSLTSAHGQDVFIDEGESEPKTHGLAFPYVFATDQLGFAGGILGGMTHYPQEQASWGGTAFGSSNGSFALYLIGNNMQLPWFERLFLSPFLSGGRFAELRSYQDGNPAFPNQRAGSNDSSPSDFIKGRAWESRVEIEFKYLLPIGHGAQGAVHRQIMRGGLPAPGSEVAGGTSWWNPLASGRTFLKVKPFTRYRHYDNDPANLEGTTSGIAVGVEWNNKDFQPSPSRGHHLEFTLTHDPGWFDSPDSWTTWEVQFAKFFSLGESQHARQRVLAFAFWTADTPSWEEEGGVVSHRAPDYLSPRLGGFNRMRAYPFNRYNDRAAIYYSLEYRYMPHWNPLAEISWLDRWLDVDWWQIVPFVEVGRVAESWDFGELHSDMKVDGGLSLRMMAQKAVIRFDVAVGEEQTGFWVMVGQPF